MPDCLGLFILSQTELGYDILYDNFDRKEALLQILIDEQYGLCAYTGESIASDNAHNEHLKPQSRCRADVENNHLVWGDVVACDLHYENIVAALSVPGPNPYGAYAKADWYESELFVSPTHRDCEEAFRYTIEGQIDVSGSAPRPEAARETIKQLRLNGNENGGGVLVDNRLGYIEGLLYEVDEETGELTGDLIPSEELEELYQRMSEPGADGRLRRFSFVVLSVLEDLLDV